MESYVRTTSTQNYAQDRADLICPASKRSLEEPVFFMHPHMSGLVYNRSSLTPFFENGTFAALGIEEEHIETDLFISAFLRRLHSETLGDTVIDIRNTNDQLVTIAQTNSYKKHLAAQQFLKTIALAQRNNLQSMALSEIFFTRDERRVSIRCRAAAAPSWLERILALIFVPEFYLFTSFYEGPLAGELYEFKDDDSLYTASLAIQGSLLTYADFGAITALVTQARRFIFDRKGLLNAPYNPYKRGLQGVLGTLVLAKLVLDIKATQDAPNNAPSDFDRTVQVGTPLVYNSLTFLKNMLVIEGITLSPPKQIKTLLRKIYNPRDGLSLQLVGESALKATIFTVLAGVSLNFLWKMVGTNLTDNGYASGDNVKLETEMDESSYLDFITTLPIVAVTVNRTWEQVCDLLFFKPNKIDKKTNLAQQFTDYFYRNADILIRMMLTTAAVALVYMSISFPFVSAIDGWEFGIYLFCLSGFHSYVEKQGLTKFEVEILPRVLDKERNKLIENNNNEEVVVVQPAHERTRLSLGGPGSSST